MNHAIYRVLAPEIVADFVLCVHFDDDTEQIIDFNPILLGDLYGPLRDLKLFNQVRIDAEVHALVWPKGADFDPETLHDWTENEQPFSELAQSWRSIPDHLDGVVSSE